MDSLKIPKYRYIDGRRAYLVIAADVYGRWNIAYHIWMGQDDQVGHYLLAAPVINDCLSIEEAIDNMAKALKEVKT